MRDACFIDKKFLLRYDDGRTTGSTFMHYKRLPTSDIVGSPSASVPHIATWLEAAKAGHSTHFYAQELIEETPISGCVLYPSTAFAPLDCCFGQPLPSIAMAKKLMGSVLDMQYPEPAEHRVKWKKGWEIRKAIGPRGLLIIALTTWVAP